MSRVVRTISSLTFGYIVIFGFYVIIYGHVTPGGGFQGGVVVASAFALLLVVYGHNKTEEFLNTNLLSFAESTGLILFIALAFMGLGVSFFYNFLTNSGGLFGHTPVSGVNPGDVYTGGLIPLMELAVGLEVLSAMGVIILVISGGAASIKKKKEKS
jgi:multicomponent Na+:H+ antiporter subunit B